MSYNLLLKTVRFYIKKTIEVTLYMQEQFLSRVKAGKKVEMSVADILLINSNHGELLKCDIIVKYLAIENYYQKNDFGFQLYERMQEVRLSSADKAKKRVEMFKTLIESYERNGYDKESKIVLYKDLKILDGSHRIALALYHDIPNINVLIINMSRNCEYSIDWFISNGFSCEEVKSIVNKYKEILEKANSPYSGVIWGPATMYSKEIIEDLENYGDVVSTCEYTYSADEYRDVVRRVYSIDDIKEWKVEKKLEYMRNYPPRCVIVDIRFNDPEFRIKKATGLPLSRKGERAKKAIRDKYKRRLDNYFFDIIIHIADNAYQSEYMRNVFDNQ